jgi:hypothetical protein
MTGNKQVLGIFLYCIIILFLSPFFFFFFKTIKLYKKSDISDMVPETLDYIQKTLPPTDVLIVDSLNWGKNHPVHYTLEQAVELAQTIKPKIRTFLIGMSCDYFLPHDEMNTYLRELYGDGDDGNGVIVMAHDGLIIDLPTGPISTPISTAKHDK